MFKSLNRVDLLGRLGSKPEISAINGKNGDRLFTRIKVVTWNWWRDANGQWIQKSTWHSIAIFGMSVKALSRAEKGDLVYISGSLETNMYIDKKTGQSKYSTGIVANNVILIGKAVISKSSVSDIDTIGKISNLGEKDAVISEGDFPFDEGDQDLDMGSDNLEEIEF